MSSKVKYQIGGRTVTAEEFRKGGNPNWLTEGAATITNTYTEHDPLMSEGCGVMRSQVEETRAMIKHHNIKGVAIMPDGQARITSRRGRKEFLHATARCDNDGGYSD